MQKNIVNKIVLILIFIFASNSIRYYHDAYCATTDQLFSKQQFPGEINTAILVAGFHTENNRWPNDSVELKEFISKIAIIQTAKEITIHSENNDCTLHFDNESNLGNANFSNILISNVEKNEYKILFSVKSNFMATATLKVKFIKKEAGYIPVVTNSTGDVVEQSKTGVFQRD